MKKFLELRRLIEKRQAFEEKNTGVSHTTLNFLDDSQNSLLNYAIQADNLDEVKKLIAERFDPSLFAEGKNPMQQALQLGHLEIAKYLYDEGCYCGDIPLASAKKPECYQWFSEKIQENLLISCPIENNGIVFKQPSPFFNGNFDWTITPKHRASEIGHLDYLKVPYADNCKIRSRTKSGVPAVLKVADEAHCLYLAATHGKLDLLDYLIHVKQIHVDPKPHVDSAFQGALEQGELAAAQFLLEHGADRNWPGIHKNTALMHTIRNNNPKALDFLLSSHVNVHARDVSGNTILHIAAEFASAPILERLLELPDVDRLLKQQNIYGQTFLDIAYERANPEILQLLRGRKLESTDFPKLTKLNQAKLNQKFTHYLKLDDRNPDFFFDEGHCNGYSGLFLYYCSKGRSDYFFNTLELIANWDGTEESLTQLFPEDSPYIPYKYKNLRQLMEQWVNDLKWIQHDQKFFNIFSIHDRLNQFGFFSNDHNYLPHNIFKMQDVNSFDESQMQEVLHYCARMPKGACMELGGGEHKTAVFVDHTLKYYDSNFEFLTPPIGRQAEKVWLQRILDYKYAAIQKDPQQDGFSFEIYYYPNNLPEFKSYLIFKPDELPKTREEAILFQNQSPNGWTPLHIAIIFGSLESLNQVLNTHCADVNAKDRFRKRALDIAIEQKNEMAVSRLLEESALIIDSEAILTALEKGGSFSLLKTILDHVLPNKSLPELLNMAIRKGNIYAVKYLVEHYSVNVNTSYKGELPITMAINQGSLSILEYFLDKKASLILKDKTQKTPLQLAVIKEESCNVIISRFDQLENQEKSDFLTALIQNLNMKSILDLVEKHGIDVLLLQNEQKQTYMDCLLNKIHRSFMFKQEDQKEGFLLTLSQLLLSHSAFDLNDPACQDVLFKLLEVCLDKHYVQLFQYLLPYADASILGRYQEEGLALLHRAFMSQHFDLLSSLVDHADLTLPTQAGDTCLHLAMIYQHQFDPDYLQRCIALFIEKGMDPTILNQESKKAEDYLDSNQAELKALLNSRKTFQKS